MVYDFLMKYVFLAIFVLLAAQPLQASLSDMCGSQGTSFTTHGDMDDMDCCDQDPTGSSDNCGPMSHCGTCTAGVVTVSTDTTNAIFVTDPRSHLPGTGEPLSRFNSPPFRPPIS